MTVKIYELIDACKRAAAYIATKSSCSKEETKATKTFIKIGDKYYSIIRSGVYEGGDEPFEIGDKEIKYLHIIECKLDREATRVLND